MPEESIIKPIYQKIAIDLASRIAKGEFLPGDKIRGRSTLASEYNVSPETIRRSITLLSDMDIVDVNQGIGIIVKSNDKVFEFIEKFKVLDSINSIKNDIYSLLSERKEVDEKINENIEKLINTSERFKNTNPFAPLEIKVTKESTLLGKTLSEVKFWQETGATVIGIRRLNQLILSPGPYAVISLGDILIAIGDENSYSRITSFLYK